MISISFGRPEYLIFLIAIPLLMVAHYMLYRFTKRKAIRFANFDTLKRVTGEKVRTTNYTLLIMRLVALIALVFALAQITLWYDGEVQQTDYVFAIDNSASMTATDLEPTRLEAAKSVVRQFSQNLETSASIGLVSFAGISKIQQTSTNDFGELEIALDFLEADLSSGTDIGGAIITSSNLLASSRRGKAVILLTDGSNTVGTSLEDPVEQGVAYAKENQVVVHAVGMGSEGQGTSSYLPALFNGTSSYNIEDLQYITNQTGGIFVEATNEQELQQAFNQLQENTASTRASRSLVQPLLLLILLLLFAEWGLSNTRLRLIP